MTTCATCRHAARVDAELESAYHPIAVVECRMFRVRTRSILAAEQKCRFAPPRWESKEVEV